MSFMTLCGMYITTYIIQLNVMLIGLMEWTYGQPVAPSGGSSGRAQRGGRGGHGRRVEYEGCAIMSGIQHSKSIWKAWR